MPVTLEDLEHIGIFKSTESIKSWMAYYQAYSFLQVQGAVAGQPRPLTPPTTHARGHKGISLRVRGGVKAARPQRTTTVDNDRGRGAKGEGEVDSVEGKLNTMQTVVDAVQGKQDSLADTLVSIEALLVALTEQCAQS